MRKTLVALGLVCLATSCADVKLSNAGNAASFADPPSFTSTNHVLDLLVIARPSTIQLGSFQPTAWVFEMCETAVAQGDDCPADARTVAPYGGIRLQLYPGDHLRMRLINRLPPVPADAENAHGSDSMMNEMLAANPVNIHTHGLIVEPRKADASDPTYGDYVYVLGYPAGKLPSMVDPDETATDQPIQYDIYIPTDHPSGLYYFHPHVHGLGVNQLSEGLSGLITIGSVTDYLGTAGPQPFNLPVRYVVLKDMQVLANGDVQDQEDASFCAPTAAMAENRNGSCAGIDNSNSMGESAGGNYTGGRWYFTVNGQVYPQVSLTGQGGEIWRFLNAAASRSYDLVIEDDETHAPIPFQVVALDGVALAPPSGSTSSQIRLATGNKVDPVPCQTSNSSAATPVCATHLVMLPSSRAEIWIAPPAGIHSRSATMLTRMFSTGAAGDDWPAANLAHISFGPTTTTARAAITVRSPRSALLSSSGLLGAPVNASFAGIGPAVPLREAQRIAKGNVQALGAINTLGTPHAITAQEVKALQAHLRDLAKPVASLASPTCAALPAAHHRRIFFGVPPWAPDQFGLGYEEVDENGNPVPGTFQDIAPFDPTHINVCLPLGPGNTPVTEEWELVNVSGETHNFHMHQTKFTVLSQNAPDGDSGALMDNVPLPNGGTSCDGTVALWRLGTCKVPTVYVQIPFAEVGDFVYHCHIGEHQDGGMMAHIRVIAQY